MTKKGRSGCCQDIINESEIICNLKGCMELIILSHILLL